MPDEDFQREGFQWSAAFPDALGKTIESLPRDHFMRLVCTKEGFDRWRNNGESMWVIRFKLVSITHEGQRQLAKALGLAEPQPGQDVMDVIVDKAEQLAADL